MDYVSRTTRAELVRRALSTDLAGKQDAISLTVLREFLRRAFAHMGAADHAVCVYSPFMHSYLAVLTLSIQASDAYLVHLMNSSMPEAQAAPFISVTLELISMHITLVSNLLSHLPSVRAKTHLE